MKDSLNILFIHKDPCSRAYKEAASLKKMGHRVDLACERIKDQPGIREHVEAVHEYADLDELGAIVRAGGWDIIHGHNEPNEPTETAIRNAGGTPVVFDCHDFRGLRQTLDEQEQATERCCFEESDAVIVVSETMTGVVGRWYAPRRIISLPCYCLTGEMRRTRREKLPGTHLVYQGTILDKGIYPLEYRNYHPFFKQFTENGIHTHVYCGAFNPRVQASYIALQEQTDRFHFHQHIPYADLLDEMSQYHWGLTAFNVEDIHEEKRLTFLNSILPNKLFDYLFSGVCPIVCNNATAGRWVERHNAGFYARNQSEMLEIMLREKPKPYFEDISFISMEQHMREVEDLYRSLLRGRDTEARHG